MFKLIKLINDGGDCRAAPATPGLLIMGENCWKVPIKTFS